MVGQFQTRCHERPEKQALFVGWKVNRAVNHVLDIFDAVPRSDSNGTLTLFGIIDISDKEFEFGNSKAGIGALVVVHGDHGKFTFS